LSYNDKSHSTGTIISLQRKHESSDDCMEIGTGRGAVVCSRHKRDNREMTVAGRRQLTVYDGRSVMTMNLSTFIHK